ncbi:hypothetical protein PG997_009072 [Apiospora hydei]|uniref:Uncharacterized protein n=1 Tax=Apiospora hydei TaxID=1337664 RepID=A0ABR1VT23_9PEZI
MSDNAAPQDSPSAIKPKTPFKKLVDSLVLRRNYKLNSKVAKQPPSEEARPEDYLTIHNLVAALRTVDFCQSSTGSGVRVKQLERMMSHWEESEKKFPWAASRMPGTRSSPGMSAAVPGSWSEPTGPTRKCGIAQASSACSGAFTLGTIWTSNHPEFSDVPPPDPSGGILLSHWTKTCFKLMVEVKEDEKGVPGCPTGAVWVVNNSGYHRKDIEKGANTQLEGVLMARVADSFKDLVDCGRRSRWPKFEKAEADYLDYYPCYQRNIRGPIVWKHAPDDECY